MTPVHTKGKKPAPSESSSDSDSSSEEEDPNTRRALLDEFRRRYKYNIPMYHQFSEAMCKRVRKEQEKRTISFYGKNYNPMVAIITIPLAK